MVESLSIKTVGVLPGFMARLCCAISSIVAITYIGDDYLRNEFEFW